MRTKSEARKDAILGVALEVFREVGCEAASMSQISARVGGSKATLYNYFASKEELLLEAMLFSAHKHAQDVMQLLQIQGDLPTQLHRFVTSLLTLIDADETIQVLRVAISVGGTSDIGRSEEHTSELQSLMRISYAVFCLKKKNTTSIESK